MAKITLKEKTMNKFISECLLLIIFISVFIPRTILSETVDVSASLTLIGAGAKWASKEKLGIALYVNWQDNLYLHPNPYGPIQTQLNTGDSISYILEEYGFKIEFAGDIPDDLNPYSLVVLNSYWSIEPKYEPIVRDYLSKGGGVVIIGGAPCYFICYCKDYWAYKCGGHNLASIQDWFGAARYLNTGGYVLMTVDNPFGLSLKKGDILIRSTDYSFAAVTELQPNVEVIAKWESGGIFSFRYENTGRVYYQSYYEKYEKFEKVNGKKITELTILEVQDQIARVNEEIINLKNQQIQLIKNQITDIQKKISDLETQLKNK
jgi:hypothetical protein